MPQTKTGKYPYTAGIMRYGHRLFLPSFAFGCRREFVDEQQPMYELAQYPLLFETGQGGWSCWNGDGANEQATTGLPQSATGHRLALHNYTR